ncbi:MAG TPA: Nif3-like dinuclear metal center hexameric protein [Bacteroidia bacterium]|jgi:dinuclear metal center YbgI/SA1388 family protein|nr:Nif3-like dinuclear metal center hexameric protein [Bacteroidia bacterium]
MKLKEIISSLEQLAPPSFQESYDNSGLITGDPGMDITGALISLDCLEQIVDEAIANKCNLVVSHHPIVFSGLKKISGRNYVERTIIKAIKNDIAIYAIHTNLDNVHHGVNAKIAEKLGVKNTKILSEKRDILRKFVTYCPEKDAEKVREALWKAGAGEIGNYNEVSFNINGTGTYKGNELSNPAIGEKGKRMNEPEVRIEMIYTVHQEGAILRALRESHPYEEIAYDLLQIDNAWQYVGSGMYGELETEMEAADFLRHIQKEMLAPVVRHTTVPGKKIKRVAFCGGSGAFLVRDAMRVKADIFVTSDLKYHQFFDGEDKMILADIGHFENEQFTIDLLYDYLTQKFPTFAVRRTGLKTNPITYLT